MRDIDEPAEGGGGFGVEPGERQGKGEGGPGKDPVAGVAAVGATEGGVGLVQAEILVVEGACFYED